MTTLNAAPTAAAATPSGMAGSVAVPVRVPQGVPVQLPYPASRADDAGRPRDDVAPEVSLPGSSPAAAADRAGAKAIALDKFAKQGGPDAAVQTAAGVISVHAVFQLDAKTRELSVAIVSEDGQLIRMIPPESVARMIAAMATYRGR